MSGLIREAIDDVLCLHHSDFFIVLTVAHCKNKLEVYLVVLLYCFTFKYIALRFSPLLYHLHQRIPSPQALFQNLLLHWLMHLKKQTGFQAHKPYFRSANGNSQTSTSTAVIHTYKPAMWTQRNKCIWIALCSNHFIGKYLGLLPKYF